MAIKPKLTQITSVVMPSRRNDRPDDVVVFALDEEGGLWKWDSGMTSGEWVQVCKRP